MGRIGWRLIEGPATRPFTDIEVYDHLRISHDQVQDLDYIRGLVDTAVLYVESRGHLLVSQVWEMLLDGFPPCEPILVFKGPVDSIDFIKYIDTDGNEQTWDENSYQAALTSDPVRIQPAWGESWPSTRCQPESVTIRFTGGYNGSPPEYPSLLRSAMLLLIAHLYHYRLPVVLSNVKQIAALPFALEDLLDAAIGRKRVY